MSKYKRMVVSKINPSLRQRASALIDVLQSAFPTTFPTKPSPKVPLAIGIYDDLFKLKNEHISKRLLQTTLNLWCRGRRYLEALSQPNTPRYALDGSVCGIVSELQALDAQRRLKNYFLWIKQKDKRRNSRGLIGRRVKNG